MLWVCNKVEGVGYGLGEAMREEAYGGFHAAGAEALEGNLTLRDTGVAQVRRVHRHKPKFRKGFSGAHPLAPDHLPELPLGFLFHLVIYSSSGEGN